MLPNLLDNSDHYKSKPFFSHHNDQSQHPSNKVTLPFISKKSFDHNHSKSFEMSYSHHWKINELPKP